VTRREGEKDWYEELDVRMRESRLKWVVIQPQMEVGGWLVGIRSNSIEKEETVSE